MRREKSIFIGTVEIAGMMSRLNAAFAKIGVESVFYSCNEYAFDVKAYSCPDEMKACHDNIVRTNKARIEKKYMLFFCLQIVRVWLVLRFFLSMIKKHDQFFYIFGANIFSMSRVLRPFSWLELCLLRMLNKKIVVWFCGTDSRAPFCDGNYPDDTYHLKLATEVVSKRVSMFDEYATEVIDGSASAFFHSRPYILSQKIGIPIAISSETLLSKDRLVIVHAPSHLACKGTDVVRMIVNNLKHKGYKFEYKELHNVDHSEVEAALKSATLVIDQVYSDTPLAGLATEAAAYGVPSVVGGYYAKYIDGDGIFPDGLPSFFVEPDKIEETLEYLLNNPDEINKMGQKAKNFVLETCEEKKVARRIVDIFDGEIDSEFYIDPKKSSYIYGCGISKDRVRNRLKNMICDYGMSSLCISKNMKLYKVCQEIVNR